VLLVSINENLYSYYRRDLLKSDSAMVSIPELDLVMSRLIFS